MLGRVFHVQVLEASDYKTMSASQSVRRDVLAPKRGEILDRNYAQLAVNAELKLSDDAKGRDWTLTRVCPNGALAGQVLGNVGREGFGQSGLELSFDKVLRGSDGWRYARHDARNRYYPEFDPRAEHAVDGRDVVLTLDFPLQAIVEQALERGVMRVGAKRGTAVVVDPKTGDMLALANYPFYNPNVRERTVGEAWKNLAVTMLYEPGSTFKVITAAALLEEKVIAPEDSLDGEQGNWSLAGQWIRDTHPYGVISFRDAMAYSSNIVFAKAGMRISAATYYRYLRSFGFGMKTGIGLPAEESGSLKPVADWSGRTQQTIAFGHEISVTPLQLVMALSAIANDGILMRPRIVKGYRQGETGDMQENPVRKVRQVVSAETASRLRGMLESVVEYGTAIELRRADLSMAGKTGTSEKIDPVTGKYVQGSFHSSFVGMAPADQPALVCLIMVDEPTQFKYGGQSAGPIFREIVDRLAVSSNPVVALPTRSPIPAEPVAPVRVADSHVETAEFQPVNLVDTAPDDSIRIPDVRGASLATAKSRLGGFTVIVEGSGSRVLAQVPVPGMRSVRGQEVRLSLGEWRPGNMPDVQHCTLRDALLRLKDLGLEVEYRGQGRVLRQTPEPGTPVKAGESCTLELGWMG
jgi:cell division protein FtsI (penicillin-binding protein 3)